MKVLISAFSCGPGAGSEPGVGWNWVQQVSRQHEVWVLIMDEYQEACEREAPPNVHVVTLPSFHLWRSLQRFFVPGLDWAYYYWWQWKAYRLARRLHAKVHFDVAHHATFCSWRIPSFLCLLPVPLIWGPIGGGGAVPTALRGELGLKGRVHEKCRDLGQRVSRWDPLVRLTMRRAAVIVAANRETADLIPNSLRSKVQIMSCCGMAASEKASAERPEDVPDGFVVLCAGVLEARKAGTLALKAFARFVQSQPGATLVFTGRGPERERLEALAASLGVAGRVRFLGGLPRRSQVLGWMQAADVLLFPSLRESSPVVLLEAMTAGTPVICLDQGGGAEMIGDGCGFKVGLGKREEVIAGLARSLERLAADPQTRQAMGERGKRRVEEHFDWDERGQRMLEIYRRVTAATPFASLASSHAH